MRARSNTTVVATLVALVAVFAGCSSTAPPSATTVPPASSSTSTSTSVPSIIQPATAIWPFVANTPGYPDPVEAARTFAVDYLGFATPVIGSFQQGDSQSGEVNVQASPSGPVTTVLVRMLTSASTWWVLGASTPNLRLESPAALATIASPVILSGQSTAFEATVNVQIRQDGMLTPLKEDILMGGANGDMGPFSKSISFPHPNSRAGAIVLKTMSAKDGNISEASVIRVSFSS